MRYIISIMIVCLILSCNKVTERMPHYDVHGIDVSHYQSAIEWDTVAAQQIDFAFVKATEGKSLADSMYCTNWYDIKRVGLKRGAYHFFRPTISVIQQAQNFMDNVTLEEGDLPPVLDVEVTDGASEEEIVDGVRTWLSIIEYHYKIKPIIYTNLKYFNLYIDRHFDEYPIWIARYNTKKHYLGSNRNWLFWQYGNRGQLKGIDGFVDFNVFDGSLLELNTLCLSSESAYSSN